MPARFFLSTRLWYFLTEVPLILLFGITVANHAQSTDLLKFYPLEIITVAGMVVTFLYFFRTATLTHRSIRKFSVFSDREEHIFAIGEQLVLLLDERGYLHITVQGEDDAPALSWCKNDRRARTLFRTRVIFATLSASSLLSLFGMTAKEIEGALGTAPFLCENEQVSLSADMSEHGRQITLTLLSVPKEDESTPASTAPTETADTSEQDA